MIELEKVQLKGRILMKNRIISLVLCVISLAASIFLLTSIINRGDVVIKTPDKTPKDPEILQPVNPSVGDKVELSEVGISAFASRIEAFVTRQAYENDKSTDELVAIVDNIDGVIKWLKDNSYERESECYLAVSELLVGIPGMRSAKDVSFYLSELISRVEETAVSDSEMCPEFDSEALILASVSINDATAQKIADASTTFTVTVGGGAMLGDRIGASQEKSFRYAFDNSPYAFPFYKLSAFLVNDSMSFATLLSPLTESSEPDAEVLDPVKGLPYYAQSLYGIDCLSLSSSRILDYGQRGYDDTVQVLSENGIANGWGYRDTPYGKVAYVSVDLMASEVTVAAKDENKALVKKLVETERENGADLVILQLRWNTRLREDVEPNREINADYVGTVTSAYEQHMDAFNKEIAREAIRAGADLVVGTGSHVLQGIELFNGKYIVYSPGNLTYSGSIDTEQPNTAYAYLFQVTFEKKNGKNEIAHTRVIPVVNNSTDSPLLPTPVFDERADMIVDMLVFQSQYFTDSIKDFDYIKIEK